MEGKGSKMEIENDELQAAREFAQALNEAKGSISVPDNSWLHLGNEAHLIPSREGLLAWLAQQGWRVVWQVIKQKKEPRQVCWVVPSETPFSEAIFRSTENMVEGETPKSALLRACAYVARKKASGSVSITPFG